MKKARFLAVCAIVLSIVILCAGCSIDLEKFDNPEVRGYSEQMLDALIGDDFDTAYSLVQNICTEAEFQPVFLDMNAFLEDTDDYALRLLSIQTKSHFANGEKTNVVSADYEMKTGTQTNIVSISVEDQTGILSFYITPYEKTDYYFTGTIQTMQKAAPIQWALLLLNVLSLGFVAFAIVDCSRMKIKRKALWILLLVFGFVTLGATVSGSMFRIHFNFSWLTNYSALIRYGSGTAVIRLMLPIGAIVYFCTRRSLLKTAPENTPAEAAPDENDSIEIQES